MIFEKLERSLSKSKTLDKLNRRKKEWDLENVDLIISQIREEKDINKKKELGQKLNQIKNKGTEIFNKFKKNFEYKKETKKLDLSIYNKNFACFSNNLLTNIKKELFEFFESLNFEIEYGKQIVSKEENFDDLLVEKNHPSRSKRDTYYVKNDKLLRTHCTSNSIYRIKNHTEKYKPLKVITIGTVYRNDSFDARHTAQFNQLDLLIVDEKLNLGNLKWIIEELFKYIFGNLVIYRFRNSYFPFTSPSFEVDVKCKCDKKVGCPICGGSGWIEVMGCGMLHEDIMNKYWSESTNFRAIAGGIGIERLALIKYQLNDIRSIYENDFQFLKHDC